MEKQERINIVEQRNLQAGQTVVRDDTKTSDRIRGHSEDGRVCLQSGAVVEPSVLRLA